MTKEEIIDQASRYVQENEIVNFPMSGDIFSFILSNPNNMEAPPQFCGYGIALGYSEDLESKPRGKWIYFDYTDLSVFPPEKRSIKLQPPHIALGRFRLPDGNDMMISNLNVKAKQEMPVINKATKGVTTFYEFPKELWKDA